MIDLKKEYYIIDCLDFRYFVRPVHIIGICVYGKDFYYMIDVKEAYEDRNRVVIESELTKFLTYDIARKEVKRLNNIPENKEIRKKWNNYGKMICSILNKI